MPVGTSSEELRYHKSIALQIWLFGYELPGDSHFAMYTSGPCQSVFQNVTGATAETVMVFTKQALHILTSSKKGNFESTAAHQAMDPLISPLISCFCAGSIAAWCLAITEGLCASCSGFAARAC